MNWNSFSHFTELGTITYLCEEYSVQYILHSWKNCEQYMGGISNICAVISRINTQSLPYEAAGLQDFELVSPLRPVHPDSSAAHLRSSPAEPSIPSLSGARFDYM